MLVWVLDVGWKFPHDERLAFSGNCDKKIYEQASFWYFAQYSWRQAWRCCFSAILPFLWTTRKMLVNCSASVLPHSHNQCYPYQAAKEYRNIHATKEWFNIWNESSLLSFLSVTWMRMDSALIHLSHRLKEPDWDLCTSFCTLSSILVVDTCMQNYFIFAFANWSVWESIRFPQFTSQIQLKGSVV